MVEISRTRRPASRCGNGRHDSLCQESVQRHRREPLIVNESIHHHAGNERSQPEAGKQQEAAENILQNRIVMSSDNATHGQHDEERFQTVSRNDQEDLRRVPTAATIESIEKAMSFRVTTRRFPNPRGGPHATDSPAFAGPLPRGVATRVRKGQVEEITAAHDLKIEQAAHHRAWLATTRKPIALDPPHFKVAA